MDLMEAILTQQQECEQLLAITLTHPRSGYRIQITPGPTGFVIHSSEGLRFERYDNLSYEVKPGERAGE